MFHIKDEVLNDLEVNPWKRLRNRIINFVLSPYRLIKGLLMITGGLVWSLALIIGVATFTMLEDLPHFEQGNFERIQKDAQAAVGLRINNSNKQHNWVSLDDVNRELLYAIVMSEDGQFFTHQGIDYDALINALGENIKRREWSLGASTISQQTIKNIYLTQSKTLYRKLQEIIATRRLERALNKNQILELYLNVVEFGPDIYGLSNAASYYFNAPPHQLNAAQGAFLALLMPSPRKYHYTIYQNQHLSRRHLKKYKRILRDMRYKDYISPKQHALYLKWDFFH
jgi:monofunctional biosynthetic peptidoglycan transglycosylase